MTIRPARAEDREMLADIWLRSVRATHDFLGEADVRALLPVVRDVALAQLEVSVLLDEGGRPIGFLGTSGEKIEALFLAPESRGRGGGRMLVGHAQSRRPGERLVVDVNEENPQARGFYEAMGFRVTGRSELDGQGRPFPLLHMRRGGGRT